MVMSKSSRDDPYFTKHWPGGLTRAALVEAFGQFAAVTGQNPRFVAFTAEEWAAVQSWEDFEGRPPKILGAILLGTDSPVFYLA
jgi:hypothetical protein